MTDREELQGLVAAYLNRTADGEDPESVERALKEDRPELATGLERALETLRRSGLERAASASNTPDQLGDFHLEGRIGGGGMGVVYRARQTNVSRTVALKVIRADHLYLDGARARFQREAEAVARLAHPNIAALYAVGEESGVPYCAMEFIPGVSLDVALRRVVGHRVETLTGADLRQAATEDSGDVPSSVVDPGLYEGSWTASCLRIVRETARALEHAHERGVLHRDVKPSNVMITRGGRVVLLDFGLASLRESGALTQTGMTLGSLPYMAPEQAAGRTREIDERTDVYGLGVLLYELLGLRPPFAGRHVETVRNSILEGAHLPLRKLNTDLPRDVEVVVSRAMDLDPRRRYASAGAFARDLANLLERRPIDARPAGFLLRVDRLVRRRPAASLAVLFAAFVLIGGPAIFGAVQSRHARRMGDALEETEAHLSSALAAVGEVLRPLSANELVDTPGLQDLRVRLFGQALALVDQIAEHRPDDERVRLEKGRLETELGLALVEQGRQLDGLQHLLAGEVVLDALLTDNVGLETSCASVANRGQLGAHLHASGESAAGWARLESAVDAARALVGRAPEDAEVLFLLAHNLSLLATAHKEDGRRDRALVLLHEAQTLAERVAHGEPERATAHALLGETIIKECRLQESGQGSAPWPNEARGARLGAALVAYERALELAPGSRAITVGALRVQRDLGGVHEAAQRFDDAADSYRAALALAERLLARFPEVAEYHLERLQVLQSLAVLAGHRSDEHESLELHTRAAETHLALAEIEELPGRAHLGAAVAASNLAVQALNMDDLGAARFDIAERWLGETARLLERVPDEAYAEQQRRMGVMLFIVSAGVASERGETAKAMEQLRAAGGLLAEPAMPLSAALAEGWAVLLDHQEENAPLRSTIREAAVEHLVRAIDVGLPVEMVPESDYFRLVMDDARVTEAVASRAAQSSDEVDE